MDYMKDGTFFEYNVNKKEILHHTRRIREQGAATRKDK